MALSKSLSILLMLVILITLTATTSQASRLDSVQKVMTEKGFGDMVEMIVSMQSILFPDIDMLESINKTYTVFAPDDLSFWARSNDDPSLALVRYHIVPSKVDMDLLASPSMSEQKIDTLLYGHPLVVTTGLSQSLTKLPSINLLPIGIPDLYNDGHFIVHGLIGFFSFEYQPALYPWFDGPASPPASAEIFTGRSSTISTHTSHAVLSFFFVGFVSLFLCF